MHAIGGAGHTKKSASLTHRLITGLRSEARPYRIPDSRCPGLAVRVAVGGGKTFDLAFRIRGGKFRRLSLGRFSDIGLDAARDRANELTKAARLGRDLVLEEQSAAVEQAQRISVSELIETYAKRELRGRLRTAAEIERRLKRALTSQLAAPAEELRRRDLRESFDAVADSGLRREAEKRRQAVRAMFRWALSQDVVAIDPAAGLKRYDPGTPRDRVLSNDEMRILWAWLDYGFPPAHAEVLRLQLLTGARCGEVGGLCGDEVDTTEWTWTLPAARSKSGRARVTPLVGMARDIVEPRIMRGGALFRGRDGRPLTASHVGQVLIHRRHCLPIAHFTTHDMRRTFATGLDSIGISLDLIAAILGHESAASRETQTLVRHYLRTNKLESKRAALEAWNVHVQAIVGV